MKRCIINDIISMKIILGNAPIKNGNRGCVALTITIACMIDEIMKKAGLNTVMGMGTVFLVLILISIIIYLLGFIGKAQKKRPAETVGVSVTPAEPPVMETLAEPEDLTDDFELVAVIAAAIAASEGVPADQLVVRSIRRKASPNRWKNV